MRFEPNKAFPHPVLRPSVRDNDSDYPGHDIQTILDVASDPDDALIRVSIEFMLQHPDLLDLLADGYAEYGCLVWCQSTLYRDLALSRERQFTRDYKFGTLSDIVELRPMVVAVRDIKGYRSDSWHPEFGQRGFDIAAGSLLAQDETLQFPATQEFLKPVTSVFDVEADPGIDQGSFDVVFGNRITIKMHPKERDVFLAARMNLNHRGNILAGIMMPVVLVALTELAELDPLERQHEEWGRAFEFALERINVSVDDINANRVSAIAVAQRLLGQPLRRMTFMVEDRE